MNATVWMRRLGGDLLDRLLPGQCLACSLPVPGLPALCADCRDELPRNRHACARCALPLPAADAGGLCGACLRRPPPYLYAYAPFLYADPIDRWLAALKFAGDLAAGRLLACLLAEACEAALPWSRFDGLIALPLHRRRLGERGFNQVQELLRGFPRQRLPPQRRELLQRVRATAAQSDLSAGQRRRNLRGAFVASPAVAGLHLLLVDDVITTGSTLAEASRSLLRAGAAEVQVLALARVPRPGR